MNAQLLGVEMTPDIRGWTHAQRRVGSLLTLGLAALVAVAAVVAFLVAGAGANILYWILFGLAALVLALELAIFSLQANAATTGAGGKTHPHPSPVFGEPSAAPAPFPEEEPAEAKTLTLRCGDCGTVFDLTDNGERPLYHSCPGCGAEGVLRDTPPASKPAPSALDFAPPAAEAAPAPKPVKKLKLRCGGCKEVFTIEDSGERPLRRPCPYCSRMGEVR